MSGFSGIISINGASKIEDKLFVDATYGDDSIAERENPGKPYKTITAALVDYTEGDIMIISGDFTITSSIELPAGVTTFVLYWTEGSSLTGDITDQLIKTNNSGQNFEIHGRGVFRNNTVSGTSSSRVFGGSVEIFGAKSISTYEGVIVELTEWKNIRNVEEFYSEAGGAYLNVGDNSQHDGISGGFIENVLFGKKDSPGFFLNGISISSSPVSIEKVTFNNVKVVCESAAGTACLLFTTGNGNKHCVFNNSSFIGNDRQRVITSSSVNNAHFNNCYFESNDDLFGVNVSGSVSLSFTDCSFKANGTGSPFSYLSSGKLEFFGVNKIQNVTGSYTMSGSIEESIINHGVIYGNKVTQPQGVQVWVFEDVPNPPNTGNTYVIEANDTTSITYTVLGSDTTDQDVYDGLVAAWEAEALASPLGDFAKFSVAVVGAGSPYELRATAIDPDDNYDLVAGETFVFDSTLIPVTVTAPTSTTGISFIGGKYIVDENLIVL